jgi:hypothetical protein
MTRRRRSTAVLAIVTVAVSTMAIEGITMATGISTVSFESAPSTVARHRFEPGAINVHLQTAATHGTRTDRIEFDFDDRFRFAPGAVPTCDPEDLAGGPDMAEAMASCGSANIGTGTAEATDGRTTFTTCTLAFNGPRSDDGSFGGPPPDEGRSTVFLLVRAQLSPPAIDCSNPPSNHSGNVTLLVVGFLEDDTTADYGMALSFNHLTRVEPVPLTDLNLTLQNGQYVSARCGLEDFLHGWQLRTKVSYLTPRRGGPGNPRRHPRTRQTVDSRQQCLPR